MRNFTAVTGLVVGTVLVGLIGATATLIVMGVIALIGLTVVGFILRVGIGIRYADQRTDARQIESAGRVGGTRLVSVRTHQD